MHPIRGMPQVDRLFWDGRGTNQSDQVVWTSRGSSASQDGRRERHYENGDPEGCPGGLKCVGELNSTPPRGTRPVSAPVLQLF
jgi:hypothetical protein